MLNNFFDIKDDFNFETEKQNFVQNLDMLKSMSVQESTLYKKWQEFNKDVYNQLLSLLRTLRLGLLLES